MGYAFLERKKVGFSWLVISWDFGRFIWFAQHWDVHMKMVGTLE